MMKKILFFLLFSAAPSFATTFYVAKSGDGGSDSHTCMEAQTITTAKLTLGAGVACLSAGDTLEVRAGTYSESLNNNEIPAGISSGSRTTIKKHTGDAAPVMEGSVWISTHDNITWDGININGINNAANSGEESSTNFYVNGGSNIHLTNSEIYNCKHHCVLIYSGNGSVDNILMDYNTVHNSGTGFSDAFPMHNFYLSGSGSFPISNVTVDHTESYNANCPGSAAGPACWGLQMYSANSGEISSVTVSNSYFHDNNQGIVVGSGANHLIYNNILYNNDLPNSYGEAAITVGYGGGMTNIQVYNNTITGNKSYGAYGISVGTFGSPSGTIIKNNIIWNNGTDGIRQASGSGTVITPNLIATNPVFGNNFALQSTSPALVTNGFSGANESAIFTTDKDGTLRQTGSNPWDAGALTVSGGGGGGGGTPPPPTPPAAPTNLVVVP